MPTENKKIIYFITKSHWGGASLFVDKSPHSSLNTSRFSAVLLKVAPAFLFGETLVSPTPFSAPLADKNALWQ